MQATTDTLVVSSYLPGENAFRSSYPVHGVECRGEFAYCDGLQAAWSTDKTIVNVEHDMEFSDELVAGLIDCPHPVCAYAYQVYPTALGRFIYCATTTSVAASEYEEYRQNRLRIAAELAAGRAPEDDQLLLESPPLPGAPRRESTNGGILPEWVQPGDEWAEWSSIGFCKITPEARTMPLDRMFWQWLEHAVNRVISSDGTRWHLHWPEVAHHHDYKVTPDHLW